MNTFTTLLMRLLPILLPWLAGCAGPASPGADTRPPMAESLIAPDVLRSDFDALYDGLKTAHYDLFVRRSRADYDARFQSQRAQFDRPMTLLQARIAFQRFVAYGDVAHARIDPPLAEWERFRRDGGTAFPLSVRVDDGAVFVLDGVGVPGISPGDRLETVEGEPALAWLQRMRQHISADNDYMGWAQLERLLPLLVWQELGEVARFRVGVRHGDGRASTLDVPALDRTALEAAAAGAPARFELDWNGREARVLDEGVAYLRPGPFYDNRPEAPHPWDASAFHRFIDDAFDTFIAGGAKRLLIDLRDNPGGDNSFSDHLIAWFADRPFRFSEAFEIRLSPATLQANARRLSAQGGDEDTTSARLAALYAGHDMGDVVLFPIPLVSPRATPRFDGQVFVLINRHSYSNAVLVAAVVQDYGFGTVLGEDTSDLASTYGAMESFTLPGTGFEVGYPKARILRPNGDPQPRGVVPDVPIRTPMPAGVHDEVLVQALETIRTASAPAQ